MSFVGLPHFYLSPETLNYDFGPKHPLRPERMSRTVRLLQAVHPTEIIDPGYTTAAQLARVHDPVYIEAIATVSDALDSDAPSDEIHDLIAKTSLFGDTPAFRGMWRACLGYTRASMAAAEAVRDGAPLAFAMGGGLHHAHRGKASGFCIFNDPALAISVLREKFDRVAYVDIDVHHGDGTQFLFYDDPSVLTYSIHESGKSLYPGTGFLSETGACGTSLNVPLVARTTADVWLHAFENTFADAMDRFDPQAIVLQLGTDTHALDPLGHIQSNAQTWVKAVERVRNLGLPTVALGGGGYNLDTVPRMWVAAVLTLARVDFHDAIPVDLANEWGVANFFDPEIGASRQGHLAAAEEVIAEFRRDLLPKIPRA